MGCEPPGFSLSRTCHLLDERLNRTPPRRLVSALLALTRSACRAQKDLLKISGLCLKDQT